MKAIENIKAQISAKFVYTINKEELPELSWIYEKMQGFRNEANESLKRMEESGLFTKDELQEVADFAGMTIRDAASNAANFVKALKREQFIF